MILIKTLMTGFVGLSFCLANISGTVTDTGTTPIAGAIVQLEKGGQTAISGADGSFTLTTTSAVLPVNGKLPQNGLSGFISGNLLNLSIAERAVVEVATFNLSGKLLSTVRKSLDAGSTSILLPYHGAGIYLYKVKSGISEIVLKGNPVGGASNVSAKLSQGSFSNSLAKQAKVMAAKNDVIAATKTGYLNYRCIQDNSDTTGIKIKMIASAGTVTDADGNVYQTVKIGNQEWMVENLRVTKYNDGSAIPFDTSTVNWKNDTTPKFCYYNNTTNADSIKKYGAFYNWYVVSPVNSKKIAPTGWHVPSDAEWDTLQNYLIAQGYNWDGTITGNKIAKSLAAKTDWVSNGSFGGTQKGSIGYESMLNNATGFSALPGGSLGRIENSSFLFLNEIGYWWSSTNNSSIASCRILLSDYDYILKSTNPKSCGFSVRLSRD